MFTAHEDQKSSQTGFLKLVFLIVIFSLFIEGTVLHTYLYHISIYFVLKPGQNKKGQKMVQLENFFGPSYFVTALGFNPDRCNFILLWSSNNKRKQ